MDLPLPLPRLLLLAGAAGAAVWLVYRRLYRRSKFPPLPPGPPARFLVGNLGQLSIEDPAQDYIRWGKEYRASIPLPSDRSRHYKRWSHLPSLIRGALSGVESGSVLIKQRHRFRCHSYQGARATHDMSQQRTGGYRSVGPSRV